MVVNYAFISMGSNINPNINFSRPIELIGQEYLVLGISSFKTTKPIGIIDQPDFLNGVVLIETSSAMERVVKQLKHIEDLMGRDRSVPKFGPRIIDLDVVIWNGQVVDDDYYSRDFIREAVSEIKSASD